MELKLNVYENGSVKKTYTSSEIDLDTGTCEDLLNLVDIDKLNGKNENELGVEVIKIVSKALPTFKPILKQVFVGITDEELRATKVKELAKVIINIISYTLKELFTFNSKN